MFPTTSPSPTAHCSLVDPRGKWPGRMWNILSFEENGQLSPLITAASVKCKVASRQIRRILLNIVTPKETSLIMSSLPTDVLLMSASRLYLKTPDMFSGFNSARRTRKKWHRAVNKCASIVGDFEEISREFKRTPATPVFPHKCHTWFLLTP